MSASRNKTIEKDLNRFAFQADAQAPQPAQDHINNSKINAKSESRPARVNPMNELLKNIEKIEFQSKKKQEVNDKDNKFQSGRKVTLDLMRLKDKTFKIEKNIYNIAIGEVACRATYLSSLQEQIESLKSKIRSLEEEQINRLAFKTIDDPFRIDAKSNEHQERKPICGRIYSKESSPIFNRGSTPNHLRAQSPRYQRTLTASNQRKSTHIPQAQNSWDYKLQIGDTFHSKQRELIRLQHQTVDRESQMPISSFTGEQAKAKTLSQYRIKQKSNKHIIDPNDADFNELRRHDNLKVEVKRQYEVKRQSKLRQSSQHQLRNDNQLALNAKPEQLKQIFVENPRWEITNINDDFRNKITLKLQIPAQFPIGQPDPTDTLESFESKAAQIYKIFNIDVKKIKHRVIVRKFKNGIYFQLRPNKNIVWYFDGCFYFGEWDTELPNQAEKSGLGFEYVPNKYYYLGGFRDGNRSGRGVIKVINKGSGGEFMGYEGEWANGKPHGFGKQIDEKGNKYIGNFQMGEKTGKAVMLSKDGILYQGEVKNGLKHGKGIEKLTNGDVYTGDFSEGKFNGYGIYKWKNGSLFQGQFVKGKREGKGVWRSCNGDQFEGEYLNDLKNGWGRFSWKNGQIYEGEFKNDIRHGMGSYRHPKGKIGKYVWKDGHIDHRLEDKDESVTKEDNV